MKEWKEYKLGDIVNLVIDYRGKTPLKLGGSWSDSGYRALSAKNIKTGQIVNEESIRFVDDDLYHKWMKDEVQRGDILITSEAPFGQIYFWDSEEKIVLSQRLFCLRLSNKVYPQFVYYYMTTHAFQHELDGRATGTTVVGLRQPELMKCRIKLPSYNEQIAIASILKSLDDKIEINRRINENLEQQAQALFKSWFVDFEPFKNGEFVESELGMIPKGWRVGTLNELCCFISRGLTPKYDETSEELILGQTCVRNNIVTLNNARKHRPKTKNDKWVQQWDVLLNSTGIGSLGRVGIVYFNMDNVAIDSHITVVRTSCPLYRHYVGRNLLSRQLEFENMAVGSTGQTELPRDRVKAMPIIIPSHDAMDKFNAIIEPMAISMYSNIMESRRLAEIRDTLLPKLMSGELKVNEPMN